MKELLELFILFLKVGAFTFGGGYTMLPILLKDIVEVKKWATTEEITDYYALSQCFPGIIAINTAILIGEKRKGKPGMLAAAFGVALPSLVIIIIIALFVENFIEHEIVRHAFNGVRAAVCALVVNVVIKLWKTGVKDIYGIVIFAATLLISTFADISPIFPVIAAAICGIQIKSKGDRKK